MKNKTKVQRIAILGGILFLAMFLVNNGIYSVLFWNYGTLTQEQGLMVFGDKAAAFVFLGLGVWMLWYGLFAKVKPKSD